ncbi:WD40-repeat-containing domain protein [Podospora fimiseda]|uniref:Mitochondrial division protein 1 n=1 Tax=Podospora fimiseda TaxID=252190 RepID=A0AAN6YQG9_9PEZI|nr:WD40-repeat-containing domain protein [Podospora fimiseda]
MAFQPRGPEIQFPYLVVFGDPTGGLELTSFLSEDERPKYAILSHTWLIDNEQEITFQDLAGDNIAAAKGAGYAKIQFCADRAARDGLELPLYMPLSQEHFWIDTCCINKESSAELQETITSMYSWYRNSTKCYAYLSDVSATASQEWETAFKNSRWFTRGWTLQELIAPRSTKRKEDQAYCLLGIFNVFIPLMYGKGGNAFVRLQEEIEKGRRENEAQDEILSLLPIASEAAFNSVNNQHEPTYLRNTRAELLGEVEKWAEGSDDKSIYWLSGIAARTYSDRHMLGASFFFSKGGGDLSNSHRVITTIARQLATRIPATKPYITKAITSHKDIAEQTFKDQWDELIVGPLSKVRVRSASLPPPPESYIRLRIFLTNRPEIAIRHSLGKIPDAEREIFVLHEISDDIVNRDLSLFFKSNFSTLREECDLSDDWPGKKIIDKLVQISGGLFIWASTACRFIRQGKRLMKKRVKILLEGYRSEVGPEKQLDQIYLAVIRDSIHRESSYSDEDKLELYDQLRQVLGSIVVLFSPLSIISLARLLSMDIDDVKQTLADLHTIFHIPSKQSRPIRLHHPTFRDFLLDPQRSSGLDFSVVEREAHDTLARSCLELMRRKLKRDLCRLGSPGTLVKTTDPARITECIPSELQYSGKMLQDGEEFYIFFQEYFIYWVEAICILGKSAEMGAIIRLYNSILQPELNIRQTPFVTDANAPRAKDEWAYVNDIEFTPDASVIAAGSDDFSVTVWDLKTRALRYFLPKAHSRWVNSVVFSPNGKLLASGSMDETVALWDVETGTELMRIENQSGPVNTTDFSPNGTLIATGSFDQVIRLWDVSKLGDAEFRLPLDGHTGCVNSVRFSAKGDRLVSGSDDTTVRIWDIALGAEIRALKGHSKRIMAVTFSLDGQVVVSGSEDTTIRVWDVNSGSLLRTLLGRTSSINTVVVSPDGQCMASGSFNDDFRLWDARTFDQCGVLENFDLIEDVNSGSASGAMSGSELLKVPLAVTLSSELKAHSSPVTIVTFSPDGQCIASGSEDGTIKLWALELNDNHTLKVHTSRINHLAFSPRGKHLVASSADKTISVGHSDEVLVLCFSPSGTILASCSADGSTLLWDTLTGSQVATINIHKEAVTDAVFSPNQDILATCSMNTTMLNGHSGPVTSVAFFPNVFIYAMCK